MHNIEDLSGGALPNGELEVNAQCGNKFEQIGQVRGSKRL